MGDIRLKKHPFEYGGKAYELSVNMNVLADLQELHDGDLNAVLLKGRTMKTVFEIAAAAMNDYEGAWQDARHERVQAAVRADDGHADRGDQRAGRSGIGRRKKREDHGDERYSVNFPWFLNIWINILHNDETVFWRTMTPARCVSLYREYFELIAPRRTSKVEDTSKPSLHDYIAGVG